MQPQYGYYKINVNGVDTPTILDKAAGPIYDSRYQEIQPNEFLNLSTRTGDQAIPAGTAHLGNSPVLNKFLSDPKQAQFISRGISSLGYKIDNGNIIDANGKVIAGGITGAVPTAQTSSSPTAISASGSTKPTGTTTPSSGAATTAQAADQSNYQIQQGDTLSAIAAKNGTSIQAIMAANPSIKNPNLIRAGSSLVIPGPTRGTQSGGTANDYQNRLLGKISGVTDQNNTAAVMGAAAAVPYDTNSLPPAVNTTIDSLIGTLAPAIQNILNPATHQKSLVEEYNSLATSLGIDSLQTQYMNLEKVINGTEDDIRAEVTKSGGFMSESQVMALSAARNKTLIQQANMLQEQITTKTNTLNTLIGLDAKDRETADKRVETATNLTTSLATLQNTIQKNASDGYNKIVANVGYTGLAGALAGDPYSQSLAEKSLLLPPGTLSNPAALAKLETYRQQTLTQGQQKINISVANASSLASSRDALTLSRYASATNSVIKALYPTNKNPIQLYNNSSQVINRIDEAYKIASDPKNKNKTAADLDLIDAYVSIARGGQQITEAQVDTLLKGLGIKAKFDVGTQKIIGTATLDNGTRKSLSELSHQIYNGQKKLADQAVGTINARLEKSGVPPEFQFSSPEEVGDTSQYGTGNNSSGPGSIIMYNGAQYKIGDDGETLIPQ